MEMENQQEEIVLYQNYPRFVWIGVFVGGITFLIQHLVLSFLMVLFSLSSALLISVSFRSESGLLWCSISYQPYF
jgi:hypothetical protein